MDLGIGEVFNTRVAGNIVNDDILGSMEFACQVAGAKVVLVMGHTACGAIKGAIDRVQQRDREEFPSPVVLPVRVSKAAESHSTENGQARAGIRWARRIRAVAARPRRSATRCGCRWCS
jgi:carbonic anhydrase